MDRRGAAAALLIGAALAAAAPALSLREARWLAPGVDVAEALGREPAECLAVRSPSVSIGRAAFRSPFILGGQAARAGLSCNSCHVNGHDNPAFVFPGLSAAPGTADVTSSLTSRSRGDDNFNPQPIPSLRAPPVRAPHDPESRALEAFIRGLVVEEFDGPEPSAAVLRGLADYVRALDDDCTGAPVPVTLGGRLGDVREAVTAARGALAGGDTATAIALLDAARAALGRVAERFPPAEFADESAALHRLDRALAEAKRHARADPKVADGRLGAWLAGLETATEGLRTAEPRSLFNAARLAVLASRR